VSEIVVRVENLGKRYLIDHQRGNQPRYHALRDVLADTLRSAGRKLLRPFARSSRQSPTREELWALHDVSFELRRGDVVGVIGRNGAGKSTLLKVLSRITEPTTGRVTIDGRLASLLEVGTGFHPELTGRENIFLNGAILGMPRAEVQRKFDEIVAFAEVEKFLDTPVKRYSSGMYVRLAFSVAAHLEPDILVVDEVLAVGDAAFQKKCLGKMENVAEKHGRTLLFVSHNSAAVAHLCKRGLLFERGRLTADTTVHEALNLYTRDLNTAVCLADPRKDFPHISRVELDEQALQEGHLRVHVHFRSPFPLEPVVGVVVYNRQGSPLFGSNPILHSAGYKSEKLRSGVATLLVRDLPLYSGSYTLSVWLVDRQRGNFDTQPQALVFDFVSPHVLFGGLSTEKIGPFHVPALWELSPEPE
jgi:lipopolysaccharide transport system ATP-binding protein